MLFRFRLTVYFAETPEPEQPKSFWERLCSRFSNFARSEA